MTYFQQIRNRLLFASALAEEGVGHLDVSGHSDLRIALQRFAQQDLRFLTITCGSSID